MVGKGRSCTGATGMMFVVAEESNRGLVDAHSQQRAPEMKVLTDDTNGLTSHTRGPPPLLTQRSALPRPPPPADARPRSGSLRPSPSLPIASPSPASTGTTR